MQISKHDKILFCSNYIEIIMIFKKLSKFSCVKLANITNHYAGEIERKEFTLFKQDCAIYILNIASKLLILFQILLMFRKTLD